MTSRIRHSDGRVVHALKRKPKGASHRPAQRFPAERVGTAADSDDT
jgi:hypothetical protein